MATPKTAAFQSQSFQDSLIKAEQEFADVTPTELDMEAFALREGFDPDSYKEEYGRYVNAVESGEQIEQGGTFLGRILGRTLGEVAGIGTFAKEVLLPESMADTIESYSDQLAEDIPEDIRREMVEMFDPYHGEGLAAGAENITGHLASILIPYTGVMKSGKAITDVAKFLKGKNQQKKINEFLKAVEDTSPKNKRLTFRSVEEKATDKIDPSLTPTPYGPRGLSGPYPPQSRALVPIERSSTALVPVGQATKLTNTGLNFKSIKSAKDLTRMERLAKRTGTGIKHGTGFAIGATMVEDPDENFVNMLVETFPEAMDFLEPLAINPDDPAARKYGKAFINHMLTVPAAEALFMPFYLKAGKPSIERIASATNRLDKSALVTDEIPIVGLMERLRLPLRNWSSTKGTDKDTLALVLKRDGAAREAATIANSISLSLKEAMKNVYGKEANNTKIIENINDALAGTTKKDSNKTMIDELIADSKTNEVGVVVKEMRDVMDELSTAIGGKLRTGKMSATIDKNLNTYINRSYRAFDDPSWQGLKDVPTKVKADAEEYLINQVGIAKDDLGAVLKYISNPLKREGAPTVKRMKGFKGEDPNKFVADIANFARGASKPLTRRKYQAPQLRALWGEYKDPYKNFGTTFEKLSVLKAEQDFIRDIKTLLTRKRVDRAGKEVDPVARQGIELKNKKGEVIGYSSPSSSKQLFDLGKAVEDRIGLTGRQAIKDFDNPLKGLFADEAYEDIVKNGLELASPSSPLMRNWIKYKAFSQIAKTVASPATHGRNIIGNTVIMLANGFVPFGKGQGTFITKRILGKNDREFAKEIGELQRLGVLDSDVRAETVRASLQDMIKKGSSKKITNMMDKATLGIPKAIGKKTMQLYRDEDNMFKLVHFNKTRDYLKKAFPDKSRDEIMAMAGQRTRDLMPNYNLVNKRLKQLRRAPIGDFLSFPAEMIRTSLNLGKYAIQDIKSGNPVLMRQGFKRLGMMSVVALGGDAAVTHSRNVFGITEEQEKAINEVVPPYQRNVPRLYLSGINKDKNNRIGIDYINLGPIDPYDYMKYIARVTNEALLSDEEVDWAMTGLGLWDKVLGPFLGPSMITEAALKLANKDFDPLQPGVYEQAMLESVGPFTPGFIPLLQKRLQYERSLKERQKLGLGAVGKYGNTLTEDQVALWPSLAGIQEQRLDLSTALGKNLPRLARQVGRSRSGFKNSPAYKDQTLNDPEGLTQAYYDSQQMKIRDMKRLKKAADSFRKLTPDGELLDPNSEDYRRAITLDGKYGINSGTQQLIQNAWDDLFLPDFLTENDRRYLRNSNKTIPLKEIEDLYNQFNNSKIKDD